MRIANKLSTDFQEIFPEVLNKTSSATEANLSLRVPEELSFFDGHFDGSPLVPGYIMIAWALSFAKQEFNLTFEAYKISNAKFTQKITPGMKINLNLTISEQPATLNFTYSETETLKSCAKGALELNPDLNQNKLDE